MQGAGGLVTNVAAALGDERAHLPAGFSARQGEQEVHGVAISNGHQLGARLGPWLSSSTWLLVWRKRGALCNDTKNLTLTCHVAGDPWLRGPAASSGGKKKKGNP